MFVNLALFHLLIIKSKKKFISCKIVEITLATITVGAVVVPLIFMIIAVKDGESILCDSSLGCTGIDARY